MLRIGITFVFAAAASLSLLANVGYAKNWNTGSSNQQQTKNRVIQEWGLLSEESGYHLCKGSLKRWSNCYGAVRLLNGAVYFGQFMRGLPNGYGRWAHPDGSWHEGEFLDAREHGKGFRSIYSVTYNGQWVKGKKSGFGRLFNLKNKAWYEGEFLNDKEHGFGRKKFARAEQEIIIEGTRDKGRLVGDSATIIFPDGGKWVGSPSNIFKKNKTSYGTLIKVNGEKTEAKLTRKKFAILDFEITEIYRPQPRQRIYSATGLPMDVGPFYIGMKEKEFLKLLSKNFKITRYKSESGGTATQISNNDISDVQEVKSLFERGFGFVTADFLDDELVKITLEDPAIDQFALKTKYKNPKIKTRNWDEVCLRNRLRSTIKLYSGTYAWNDDQVTMEYSYYEKFRKPYLPTDPAPLCVRGNILTKTYYSISDPKKFIDAMSIQRESRSKSRNKVQDSRLKQF